jgi:alpha-D-ribose 1-methylphosphonate 5-triphosphate synthase subunit PhnH
MTAPALPAPGFADPARDAQRAFRAVLDALAHPTRSYPLAGPAEPPAALGRGLAAVALTLLDEDCAVWLGGALGRDAEIAAWLAFHTGARRVDHPGAADFVVTAPDALPPLASLKLGTDEAPHLSATVVLDIRGYADADLPATPFATQFNTEFNTPSRTEINTGFNTRPNTEINTEINTEFNTRFNARLHTRFATQFAAVGPGIDGTAVLAAPWALDGFAAAWQRNTELFPRGVDLLLVGSDSVVGLPRTTLLTEVEL